MFSHRSATAASPPLSCACLSKAFRFSVKGSDKLAGSVVPRPGGRVAVEPTQCQHPTACRRHSVMSARMIRSPCPVGCGTQQTRQCCRIWGRVTVNLPILKWCDGTPSRKSSIVTGPDTKPRSRTRVRLPIRFEGTILMRACWAPAFTLSLSNLTSRGSSGGIKFTGNPVSDSSTGSNLRICSSNNG